MNLRMLLAAAGLATSVVPRASLRAQAGAPPGPGSVGGRSELFAGGETERYLRYLQSLGIVRAYPWSIRGLSPRELDRALPDSAQAHPWRSRYALAASRPRGLSVDYVRPTTTVRYNSAFPFGSNDGPVWAGRGVTTAAQAGVAARYDAGWATVALTLAPIAFRAENRAVALESNAVTGDGRFGDLRYPTSVDRPRRFGDRAYTVLDPGQSTLRVDAGKVAVGVSTANQVWGAGDRYPLVLSNNAAGYPHLFLGTSAPLDLWLVTLHTRIAWGRLDQSDYSPVEGSPTFAGLAHPGTRRFTSGVVAVVQPRGLPGLEIGGIRFFHSPWRRGGPTGADLGKPFELFFKKDVPNNSENPFDARSDVDNQVASLFMRWALPTTGFELFGEYYKEDHNFDARDFVLEPDHNAGYAIGARKVFRRADGTLLGIRGELANLESGPISQQRTQGLFYLGGYLRQGHTQRGQLLGPDLGVGAPAGSTFGVDWYTPRGRWSASWSRTLRQDSIARFGGLDVYLPAERTRPRALDVMHAIGVDGTLFRGPVDLTAGVTGVLNLNREFRRDVANLNATLGARYDFGWSRRGASASQARRR